MKYRGEHNFLTVFANRPTANRDALIGVRRAVRTPSRYFRSRVSSVLARAGSSLDNSFARKKVLAQRSDAASRRHHAQRVSP